MNKIILSIHEPCHQNWEAMTETAKGRFCSSCSKNVIDFTLLSDAQLINYFLQHGSEQTCGRLLNEQLDTVLSIPANPVKKRFGYWKYMAASALLFFTKASLKAQIKPEPAPQEHTLPLSKKADTVAFNRLQTLEGAIVTTQGLQGRVGGLYVRYIKTYRRTDTLTALVTSITGAAKIFPNPVQRGNNFSLALALKAAGLYNIEIVSASGELLSYKQIQIGSLKSTQQIATDSRWAAGLYFVRITDAANKKIAICKLVVN